MPLTELSVAELARPALPPRQRRISLPGRGRLAVRDIAGPPGATTALLLHGWGATADLNWHGVYDALRARHRIIAIDHRGHGEGLRTDEPFTLEGAAADAAALLDTLGAGPALVIGYSMGGAVAQLLARARPDLVAGLVLAATAEVFRVGVRERALFAALGVIYSAARHSSVERQAKVAARVLVGDRSAPLGDWAWTQAAGHDWLAVLAAGRALGRFDSRLWSSSIAVPVASVVTTDDSVVPPERQRGLAAAVTAPVFATPADHHTIIDQPELVRPALLRACEAVTEPAIPLAA